MYRYPGDGEEAPSADGWIPNTRRRRSTPNGLLSPDEYSSASEAEVPCGAADRFGCQPFAELDLDSQRRPMRPFDRTENVAVRYLFDDLRAVPSTAQAMVVLGWSMGWLGA
jgi:hypothetical protein